MQRFHNGYNKLISDEYIKELQGQIQKAKDTREKAKKAYEKEIANKESVAELRNSLNEMLVRQAELHSFLGRASDSEIERLKAIYGDDFEDIVRGKFGKENENKEKGSNEINTAIDNDITTLPLQQTQEKFNYDEKKAKDLLEWHKDSSPLTKDENGLPKVFYHGSETDKPFEVFLSEKDQTKWGFWFSSDANDADLYARARGNQAGKHGYKVFLKAKNIFDFNDEKNLEVLKKIFSKDDYEFMLDTLQKWGNEINVFNMLKDTNFDRYRSKAEVFKNELKKLGYDGIKELGDTIVVFDSNQIKHIDNKGSYT
ncbi:ADP-ribosyltransferase-containing protein, partial [Helicobacter bilis]